MQKKGSAGNGLIISAADCSVTAGITDSYWAATALHLASCKRDSKEKETRATLSWAAGLFRCGRFSDLNVIACDIVLSSWQQL